jgi:hypothetical protein
MSRKTTGIEIRHERACPAKQGRRCNCKPAYRAEAFSVVDQRRVRKTVNALDIVGDIGAPGRSVIPTD